MDAVLLKIAQFERGPGAAIAILKDGELVAKHTYGFADLDRHIQLTTSTQLPICSISKQMVCLVLADLIKNPTAAITARGKDISELMAEELHNLLPGVSGSDLEVAHLYNMQSGIRDYWAMTTIWGARPDGAFSLAHDAPESLKRVKAFHFKPGTEFSYSNVNFHVLARLIENVSGVSLGQLLAERVFIPAGMKTALLSANTIGHPLPCVGYEGDEKHGYLAATNRIEWSGDAGIVASLEDMIAYEKYLDRSWEDSKSNYRYIAQPQSYKDGSTFFTGFLGQGPLHIMRPVAKDIWLLADPRGMDAPAPGDWTVVFGRGEDGHIKSVSVGCWLARRLGFVKVPS